MRSKDSVNVVHIETIIRRYQYGVEGEGEKPIVARCTPDRNVMDVRADKDIRSLIDGIRHIYLRKALYLDDDYELAKKLCYDVAKLIEAAHSALHQDLTAVLVSKVDKHLLASFVLFSDNRQLIRKFLDFDYAMYGYSERDILTRWRQVEKGVALYAYATYSLANGDFARIERCIEIAEKLSKLKKHRTAYLDTHVSIWKAIQERNKEQVRGKILELIKKAHWRFNPHIDFDGYFISSPAVGYLKAAWLLDLDVEVDHKYIPMEMMPHNPLPVYEKRYWFLLDDQVTVPI